MEADRSAPVVVEPIPVVIDPIMPPIVRTSLIPWWRRRWIAAALIASGALLVGAGAMTMRQSRAKVADAGPSFSDPTTNAMFLQSTYDWNLRTPASLARAVRIMSEGKPLPLSSTGDEAEAFVGSADLTGYNLSGLTPTRLEVLQQGCMGRYAVSGRTSRCGEGERRP